MEHPGPSLTASKGYKTAIGQWVYASARFSQLEALKIYTNAFKKRPPLKPNKGNNGFISWLSGVGQPNSGASDKPYALQFRWQGRSDDIVTQDQELIALYNLQSGSSDKQRNRMTWITAGVKAEQAKGIVELGVPTHTLLNSPGSHTAGTFFLVNEANAERLELVTPLADLRVLLVEAGAPVKEWEARYVQKNERCAGPEHPARIVIWVTPKTHERCVAAAEQIMQRFHLHACGDWRTWEAERDKYSVYLDVWCEDYSHFKHAALEFLRYEEVAFHLPKGWDEDWYVSPKTTGTGGRTFPVHVPRGPFGTPVVALEQWQ
jgi:hypothetical protein